MFISGHRIIATLSMAELAIPLAGKFAAKMKWNKHWIFKTTKYAPKPISTARLRYLILSVRFYCSEIKNWAFAIVRSKSKTSVVDNRPPIEIIKLSQWQAYKFSQCFSAEFRSILVNAVCWFWASSYKCWPILSARY